MYMCIISIVIVHIYIYDSYTSLSLYIYIYIYTYWSYLQHFMHLTSSFYAICNVSCTRLPAFMLFAMLSAPRAAPGEPKSN